MNAKLTALTDRVSALRSQAAQQPLPILLGAVSTLIVAVQLVLIGRALFDHGAEVSESYVGRVAQSTSLGVSGGAQVEAARIATAHLFAIAAPAEEIAPPLSDGSLTLSGTLASSDPAMAFAVLKTGPVSQLYRVGDALPGGGLLVSVHPSHVVVNRDGSLFTVSMSQGDGAPLFALNALHSDDTISIDLDMDGKHEGSPELPQIRTTVDTASFVEQPVAFREHD